MRFWDSALLNGWKKRKESEVSSAAQQSSRELDKNWWNWRNYYANHTLEDSEKTFRRLKSDTLSTSKDNVSLVTGFFWSQTMILQRRSILQGHYLQDWNWIPFWDCFPSCSRWKCTRRETVEHGSRNRSSFWEVMSKRHYCPLHKSTSLASFCIVLPGVSSMSIYLPETLLYPWKKPHENIKHRWLYWNVKTRKNLT